MRERQKDITMKWVNLVTCPKGKFEKKYIIAIYQGEKKCLQRSRVVLQI